MADPNRDSTLSDILERLENVEAVLMQLIGGDDPDPDADGESDAEVGGRTRVTGDAASDPRSRLLAADAARRLRTAAQIRSIQAKANAMWGRHS